MQQELQITKKPRSRKLPLGARRKARRLEWRMSSWWEEY
jgi:hypothetical protein